MNFSRRQVLSAAGAVGATVTAGRLLGSGPASAATSLPAPAASGIDHIVVVMMENRSFDHFLGWMPGANGKQEGLWFQDRYGSWRSTWHAQRFDTCGYNDPDHSFEGGRIELNGGACDGWLRAGLNDIASISYYQQADLPFFGQAAPQWTVFDNYYAAVMAETYPNRFYQHCAQTPELHNSTSTVTTPTIWDNLAAAGVSGKYYFGDIPFLALWGSKYLSISSPFATFLADAAAGQLPAVSFIDPRFEDESSGTSQDDHPHADIRAGEAFLNQVYQAVTTSPNWSRTALIINFDEWGGFYDHVAPPVASADVSPVTAQRGFRVPCMLISPYAPRGVVNHDLYDHTSILKMIEWRFGLPALTARDNAANNLANALDFSRAPNPVAPTYSVPTFVTTGCDAGVTASANGPESDEWAALKVVAQKNGWTV
ncbi:MAG: phospholipase C [Marmoricola sp.]